MSLRPNYLSHTCWRPSDNYHIVLPHYHLAHARSSASPFASDRIRGSCLFYRFSCKRTIGKLRECANAEKLAEQSASKRHIEHLPTVNENKSDRSSSRATCRQPNCWKMLPNTIFKRHWQYDMRVSVGYLDLSLNMPCGDGDVMHRIGGALVASQRGK